VLHSVNHIALFLSVGLLCKKLSDTKFVLLRKESVRQAGPPPYKYKYT
jgi:hypothetical protein